MYETSDIKKGIKIELDGDPFVVVDFQFVKPGKGNAFTRCRVKNLISGVVLDKTFRSGEKLKEADLEEHNGQFLYQDNGGFHFMDSVTYEQVTLSSEDIGDSANWLLENLEVTILVYQGRAITMNLPNFVEVEVSETEPGLKGDTVSGGKKPATVSTGGIVQVPLFINRGDKIRVDTRTASYIERVK